MTIQVQYNVVVQHTQMRADLGRVSQLGEVFSGQFGDRLLVQVSKPKIQNTRTQGIGGLLIRFLQKIHLTQGVHYTKGRRSTQSQLLRNHTERHRFIGRTQNFQHLQSALQAGHKISRVVG